MAPSCKLKLARFSDQLRIQDGAECGKKEGIDEDYEMGKGMDEEEMIKLLMEREEKIKNWEEKKSIRRKEQKEMRKYIEDWRMMSIREEEPKVIDN